MNFLGSLCRSAGKLSSVETAETWTAFRSVNADAAQSVSGFAVRRVTFAYKVRHPLPISAHPKDHSNNPRPVQVTSPLRAASPKSFNKGGIPWDVPFYLW